MAKSKKQTEKRVENDLPIQKKAEQAIKKADPKRFYKRWYSTASDKLAPVTSRLPSRAFTLELLAEGFVLGGAILVNQHGLQMPSATLEAARQGAIAVASSTLVIGGLKGTGAAITSGSAYAYNKASGLLSSAKNEEEEVEVVAKPKAK